MTTSATFTQATTDAALIDDIRRSHIAIRHRCMGGLIIQEALCAADGQTWTVTDSGRVGSADIEAMAEALRAAADTLEELNWAAVEALAPTVYAPPADEPVNHPVNAAAIQFTAEAGCVTYGPATIEDVVGEIAKRWRCDPSRISIRLQ